MPSTDTKPAGWRDTFYKTPGPRGPREVFVLLGKGFCMGSADIIPGVSGGTIAFIMGIYRQLLEAIQSVNLEAARALFRLDFKRAMEVIHLRFLLTLLAGIGLAVLSMARLMLFLLENHPVPTWGFFLGLIAASIITIGRGINRWVGEGGISFIAGAVAAYCIVGLIPVSTPEALWFVFLCGFIAIVAMILPGISGSFILLILGKYQYVIGAISNPFLPQNMIILGVFAGGSLIGITGFSRLLSFMLRRYYNVTLSMLTGFMAGSLRKVWPWKEALETTSIGGKEYVLRTHNIIPSELGTEFFIAGACIIAGFSIGLFLDSMAGGKKEM